MDGKLTDNSVEENSLRKIMLRHAKKRVFLCDSSKIDHVYLHNLCHLSDVDAVICEQTLPQGLEAMLRKT